MPTDSRKLLADQVRYYDARAEEFDDCYYRRGPYDMGPEFNRRWFQEMARLEVAVNALPISGSVLELACGTGLWTRFLVPRAERLVAVDASERMIERSGRRIGDPRVSYVRADLFKWAPPSGEKFDVIFIGFFLSHVPPESLEGLCKKMATWLKPAGLVAFCDDRDGPDRPYSGDTVPEGPPFAHRRRLSGGREYTIVKVFYSPEQLARRLRELAWDAEVKATGVHFLHGTARRRLGDRHNAEGELSRK